MDHESSIQHKPTLKASALAFENGSAVPKADFDFDSIDGIAKGETLESFTLGIAIEERDRVIDFLLAGGADAHEAGIRAHMLAYHLGRHPAQNQIDLAKQLGVTQSSISRCIEKKVRNSNEFREFVRSYIRGAHKAAH